MLTQQRLYNHHILDIMTSMQSVNIMVERLAIQLKIVKHSNIKCNLCSTRGGLLFKSRRRVWKRIARRFMQMLRLAPMLIKWQLLSKGIEGRASIMCTLVFLMKKLAWVVYKIFSRMSWDENNKNCIINHVYGIIKFIDKNNKKI